MKKYSNTKMKHSKFKLAQEAIKHKGFLQKNSSGCQNDKILAKR